VDFQPVNEPMKSNTSLFDLIQDNTSQLVDVYIKIEAMPIDEIAEMQNSLDSYAINIIGIRVAN